MGRLLDKGGGTDPTTKKCKQNLHFAALEKTPTRRGRRKFRTAAKIEESASLWVEVQTRREEINVVANEQN